MIDNYEILSTNQQRVQYIITIALLVLKQVLCYLCAQPEDEWRIMKPEVVVAKIVLARA